MIETLFNSTTTWGWIFTISIYILLICIILILHIYFYKLLLLLSKDGQIEFFWVKDSAEEAINAKCVYQLIYNTDEQ